MEYRRGRITQTYRLARFRARSQVTHERRRFRGIRPLPAAGAHGGTLSIYWTAPCGVARSAIHWRTCSAAWAKRNAEVAVVRGKLQARAVKPTNPGLVRQLLERGGEERRIVAP